MGGAGAEDNGYCSKMHHGVEIVTALAAKGPAAEVVRAGAGDENPSQAEGRNLAVMWSECEVGKVGLGNVRLEFVSTFLHPLHPLHE